MVIILSIETCYPTSDMQNSLQESLHGSQTLSPATSQASDGNAPSGQPSRSPGPNCDNRTNLEKRWSACRACRQLKVRCEYDEHGDARDCKRCVKAKRECEPFVPPARKRRRKTGSRVAALEEKISALTKALTLEHTTALSRIQSIHQTIAVSPWTPKSHRLNLDLLLPILRLMIPIWM